MPYADPEKERVRRRSPEYLEAARIRAQKWRAENRELHRAQEKERYQKRKLENPDGLRQERAKQMRKWRAENKDRSNAISRRSNHKNKDKLRSSRYQKKYGMTANECDALLASQGSQCAICTASESKRGWCVDHDHNTGAVRGMLCHDCNTGLGFFRDSPERLKQAIDYLAK